jgi:hypothetical protein
MNHDSKLDLHPRRLGGLFALLALVALMTSLTLASSLTRGPEQQWPAPQVSDTGEFPLDCESASYNGTGYCIYN